MITYDQYSRISDDLYIFGPNHIIRMNVGLFNYNQQGGRESFHREFSYLDKHGNPTVTIRRSYDYFLSIEHMKGEYGQKEFIRIGQTELYIVKLKFNEAIKWFNSDEFKDLFVTKKSILKMTHKVDPINITNLPMGKYIILEPTVIEDNRGNFLQGIRMTFSKQDSIIDIPLYKFMGMVQIFNDINLIMYAQNMLTYLGRPEYGFNLFEFDNKPVINNTNGGFVGKGRHIQALTQNKLK